jgi:hypothetical protein
MSNQLTVLHCLCEQEQILRIAVFHQDFFFYQNRCGLMFRDDIKLSVLLLNWKWVNWFSIVNSLRCPRFTHEVWHIRVWQYTFNQMLQLFFSLVLKSSRRHALCCSQFFLWVLNTDYSCESLSWLVFDVLW